MRRLLYIAIFGGLLTSCQSDEVPELSAANLVVVEGWLTNIDTIQSVKLSTSQSFLSDEPELILQDAQVSISGDNGETINFQYAEGGKYLSTRRVAGKAGVNYTLRVILADGRAITSGSETMNTAPTIDSLGYDSYERQSEDVPNLIETVYYPVVKFQDPEAETNYYRLRVAKNDTLFTEASEIVLINDRFFNGNAPFIENELTIFEFAASDSISIELQEISRAGYEFLRVLKAQTTSLGSTSSITPAPVSGNLRFVESDETVLGYWGTTSIQKGGIKIIQ
ncbi:DUF4249 domain-containing protein [Marinoscillum sp.]|uniref:DUF4249 domain-containing protein n=1 Tax=Marinoscillum sp. TaxID=2024838 RepID=UPI003BA91DD0